MESVVAALAGFVLIALAASHVGGFVRRLRAPLISGFLLTGVIAGPSALGIITTDHVEHLGFVQHIALALIAFAAGSELIFEELRGRWGTITSVTGGLMVSAWFVGAATMMFLCQSSPMLAGLGGEAHLAIAVLTGAILVARSPSSAIAIVRELRARGAFTRTVLGVTVVMDAVVIVLYAVCSELADAFVSQVEFGLGFVGLLALEFAVSLALGALVGALIGLLLRMNALPRPGKTVLLLLLGLGVFLLCEHARHWTAQAWNVEILLEPLLVCMIGGLLAANRSPHRGEFAEILDEVGPPVFVAFFTLTGASLRLEVLANTWGIALILFGARLLAIVIGTRMGGMLAGDATGVQKHGWMAFVTQAGVGIGLAEGMAASFPTWGPDVSTIIISVIVLNQLAGPPLFKWAIQLVGEAHTDASSRQGVGHRAVVFGSGGGQSRALARKLAGDGWRVTLVVRGSHAEPDSAVADIDLHPVAAVTDELLSSELVERADALIAMMSDAENHRLCTGLGKEIGRRLVVARMQGREHVDDLRELGVRVVEPSTAIVSLLEHMVTSPTSTSLLLGLAEGQEIAELHVQDEHLDGLAIRKVRLPADALILSVTRDGHTIITHGDTRLRVGDRVAVLATHADLEQARLVFADE